MKIALQTMALVPAAAEVSSVFLDSGRYFCGSIRALAILYFIPL